MQVVSLSFAAVIYILCIYYIYPITQLLHNQFLQQLHQILAHMVLSQSYLH